MKQRIFNAKTHYNKGERYAEMIRKFRVIFGRDNAFTTITVPRFVQKFEESVSVAIKERVYQGHLGKSNYSPNNCL